MLTAVYIGLHDFVESGKEHQFFHLYTNQPKEKVDLSARWYDKQIGPEDTGQEPTEEVDGGTVWYTTPSEPGTTETILYRYIFYDVGGGGGIQR